MYQKHLVTTVKSCKIDAAMQHLMRIAFGNLEALWMARRSPSGGKGHN
jgi:hypothetical protein